MGECWGGRSEPRAELCKIELMKYILQSLEAVRWGGLRAFFVNNVRFTALFFFLFFHVFFFSGAPALLFLVCHRGSVRYLLSDVAAGAKKHTYDNGINYQLIPIRSCTALSRRSVLIIFKVTPNEAVMYESK